MKIQQPTDSELEILRILWDFGPSTVKFVNEKLNFQRRVGYTTTLKIMQIMTEKRLVIRNEESRSHIYIPVLKENDIRNRMIDRIIDIAFQGSASQLVMQALGNHMTSREELSEIRTLLDELEKKENS